LMYTLRISFICVSCTNLKDTRMYYGNKLSLVDLDQRP
jgi:hypothetical protein